MVAQSVVSRREFLKLAGMTAASAVLVSCAAPAAAPVAPAATNAADQSATAPQGAGWQGEIEYWDWYGPRVDFAQPFIDEWQASHPGVTITGKVMDWTEMETKLLATVAAGNGPFLSCVHNFWRYELQRGKMLVPYPAEIWDWQDLLSTPFLQDPDTGGIYAAIFGFSNNLLFYNQELLAAEGIKESDLPSSWEELFAVAAQLTKRDASGALTQAGLSLNDYWGREDLYKDLIYQQGAWQFNEEGSEALWNQEAGVQSLQLIQDCYHKYQVDDPEFLAQADAFGNGKCALYINGAYTAQGIDGNFPQMAGKWGVAQVPTFSGELTPAAGHMGPDEAWGVFTYAPDEVKSLAFDFIQSAMGTPEKRVQWAVFHRELPDSLLALQAPEIQADPLLSAQAATAQYRVITGERPIEMEGIWRTMFDDVVLNGQDVQAAADTAVTAMNKALKESGKKRYFAERRYQPPAA
jgi:ABC-type glycerol-3-phosphate transport system substrate-binding protein